jgi:hypothetical protein
LIWSKKQVLGEGRKIKYFFCLKAWRRKNNHLPLHPLIETVVNGRLKRGKNPPALSRRSSAQLKIF